MFLDGWKEKLFQHYLVWSCRPERINRHLHKVLPRPGPVKLINRCRIRVAALQLELKYIRSPLEYADEMHRQIRKAVAEGAQLVVFPEYNNLPLLGLLPGIDKMEEAYRDKAEGKERDESGEDISLAEVFRFMSPVVQPLVDAIFTGLASSYSLYIMAGSYALVDQGKVVNRSFLYGPTGDLIGSQDKAHLIPMEAEWIQKRGESFNVFKTAVGNLALPVCMDATYFETFRILELKGADIALLPILNQEQYNFWLALRGIWPRVQESMLYGVKSVHVGNLAGSVYTGKAGIYAPIELTPGMDGVLAEVETYNREAIAVADLNLEALHKLRRNHPWRDSNQALYQRYFPELYSYKPG